MISSWYEVAQGKELQQGDILLSCPVPVLPARYPPVADLPGAENSMAFEVRLKLHNVIVLSQSCDLINRKLASVIVGPIFPVDQLPALTNNEKLATEANNFRSICNFIREGNSHRFHMLNSCDIEGHAREISLVDFWAVFTVPFGFTETFADYGGPRLRLQSPYTEHLAQAYARFVMRVGLPSPIAEFKK